MELSLKVLILEDRADDAELMVWQLRKSGLEPSWVRVDSEAAFREQLLARPDVVFADYNLPNFDPLRALQLVREFDPYLPFLLISGSAGEERAVEIIKLGATDYLLKDRLGRLGPATRRALEEQRLQQQKRQAAQKLEQALAMAEAARDQTLAVLRSASDGLIVCDSDGALALVSHAAERYFPAPVEQQIGRPLAAAIGPEPLKRYFAQSLGDGHALPPAELDLGGAEGVPRYLQVQSSWVVNPRGERTGRITTLRDVTREREIDNLKNDFISTAAHELLTPLTSVLGYSELLLSPEGLDPALQRECLGYIHQKALNLAEIVDDLLDLGRIETGRTLPLDCTPCDLALELGQLIEQYRRLCPERSFTLTLPSQEIRPRLDRGKLIQALENILSNAIKYSPRASPICLAAKLVGARVEIALSDQGIGMSADQVNKALEKFFRGNTANTAAGGLGIGLTITKTIMDAHGGEIRIDSRPGQGTTVTLSFPATPTEICPP